MITTHFSLLEEDLFLLLPSLGDDPVISKDKYSSPQAHASHLPMWWSWCCGRYNRNVHQRSSSSPSLVEGLGPVKGEKTNRND